VDLVFLPKMVSSSLDKNLSVKILRDARKGGYGIAANVVYNFAGVVATVRAAEERRSPAMLLVFPWVLHHAGRPFINMMAEYAKAASVPIALHVDHCQKPDDMELAMTMPFDSIMVDMSHYELEENLQRTQDYTRRCHAKGIATEGETGRIDGGEDGIQDTADLEGLLTEPDFAKEFADKTQVDFLAPAVGNFHGAYPKKADGTPDIPIEFDRLEKIIKLCPDKEFVMHGVNDFSDELLTKVIKMGVTKINVNQMTQVEYLEFINSKPAKMTITEYEEGQIAEYQKGVAHFMDMCGSSGKA